MSNISKLNKFAKALGWVVHPYKSNIDLSKAKYPILREVTPRDIITIERSPKDEAVEWIPSSRDKAQIKLRIEAKNKKPKRDLAAVTVAALGKKMKPKLRKRPAVIVPNKNKVVKKTKVTKKKK